jgi:hypothetical protein
MLWARLGLLTRVVARPSIACHGSGRRCSVRVEPVRVGLRSCARRVERGKLVDGEDEVPGGEVIEKSVKGRRPKQDAGHELMGAHPGEGDSGRGDRVGIGDLVQDVDGRVPAFDVEGLEAERGEPPTGSGRVLTGVLTAEEAASERAPGEDADAVLSEEGRELVLQLAFVTPT